MRKLPRDIENVVVSKLLHGCSTRLVAHELGISQSCVQRVKQERLPDLERPHVGRPRVLSCIQERAFIRVVTSRGHDATSSAAKDVRNELGVRVSDLTVHRVLKRLGLSSRVKQKKPKLTTKHIRDRLDFVKRHQNWILSD